MTRTQVLRDAAGEGGRYLVASALALAADFGVYVGLIRIADVHYLVAAPAGFSVGVVLIYALSVRWIFRERRLADARVEFVLFALIGAAGLAVNQLVIYAGVEALSLSFEIAKALSVGAVFGLNFGLRKLLLFTKF